MKISVLQSAGITFLALLLLPAPGHASPAPIDWANSCRLPDSVQWEDRHPGGPAAKQLADSDTASTRSVRLVYFIPNDRSFNADVVDTIKARIPRIQTFFRDQMQAHGYGDKTFQFETDAQGEPLVHRVDGSGSDGSYLRSYRRVGAGNVLSDLGSAFDTGNSILFIVVDHSTYDNLGWGNVAGFGGRSGKNSGYALLPASFIVETAAHELGHAFGLPHDFNDGANIMSYGPGWNRLSACSAGFLAVHPFFNSGVPTEKTLTWDLLAPTVELVSPLRYPAGSTSFSARFRVTASGGRGLQQVSFFLESRAPHPAAGSPEVKACHDLRGAQDTVVAFSHDGVIPSEGSGSLSSSPAHFMSIQAVDTEGNANSGPYKDTHFVLAEDSPHHLATLSSSTSPYVMTGGAKFSPDGTILAVNSSGIQLWDTARRVGVATLSGGGSSLAFSPDGTILASGSTSTSEANIKLWNVANQTLIATLPGHTGGPTGVHSVAFSPSGDTLASGSGDRTIKLWDVANRSLIATLTGHTSHVFSVAFSAGGTLASGSRDGTVKLWDAAKQSEIASLEGNTGRVLDVAFSPDGSILASSTDGPMLLWDVATRDTVATLQGHGEASFSPDGTILATGAGRGELLLWNVSTKKKTAALGHPGRVWDPWGYGVNGVFSPDGSLLASAAIVGVELWDASEWTGVSPATSLAANPDSVALAALYNSTNGANWQDKTNWLSSKPIDEWEGVSTSLNRVSKLSLAWNRLSGTIPAELGDLTLLTYLDLFGNQLSGKIPSEIGNLSDLSWLDLHNNRLSGGIPSELGSLSKLVYLKLNSNQLSGQIPSELGSLSGLHSLYLGANQLTGTIPAELGNLTNLKYLTFSNNQLTGSLPALGSLSKLEWLFLSDNQLAGSIPDWLGNLTNLTRLHLSNNQLTGSIPPELEKLTNLTHLYLAGNQLTGCIPSGLRNVANNDLDTLGLSDCGQGQTQTRAATDFNGDGKTDFADFFLFIDAFGGTDSRYDLDGSGTVDFVDFFKFVDAFDQPGQGTKLVAMAREMLGLPVETQLHQNAPNPFNSETVISWFLLEPGPARVEVFALTGQRVAVLHRGPKKAGYHRLHWDGRDDAGRPLGSGVYLYRLVTDESVLMRKLTLLR